MLKVKLFKLIIPGIIVLFILLPFISRSSIKNNHDEKRPDRIIIELDAKFSKEEMPAVEFLHDLHTRAVKGKCTACHAKGKNGIIFTFKGINKNPSMDLYHAECIACHVKKKAAHEKSGPLTADCRSCHGATTTQGSSRQKINFDRSLHFRHESAAQIKGRDISSKDNCSACHHKYNEKTKKVFYSKGQEESCGYCHKPQVNDNIRPIRKASHDACVTCHQTLKTKDIDAGPVTCKGCHDPEEQQKIQKISLIPRLKRNQPDGIVLTAWKADSPLKNSAMKGVAFNHKFHETKVQDCKSCHHETLNKCTDCHTAQGGESKGGFISLEKAMHTQDKNRSCIGCHREFTKKSDCAGCHFQAPVKKDNPGSCTTCHTLDQTQLQSMEPGKVVKKASAHRSSLYKPVPEDKIPEKIVIDILANDYLPARFPHRKMVQAIFKRTEKSQLAKVFHTDQAGLCMGCHHNSPKTLDPPQCTSCHSKKGPGQDGRPGLKGAYHGQCITCHKKMEVKTVAATDCAKCHEEKKKEVSMDIKNKG